VESVVSPAVASLVALLIAIALSCTSQINVGLLAIGFAWLIGVYLAGMRVDAVAAGFPASLFLTSLMVANGANAGNMSPVSAVGIIANTKMAQGGLTGSELNVWLANWCTWRSPQSRTSPSVG
jgi:hypothetical protein